MEYNSTSLANVRTRLANQRTYLSFMRAGMAMAAIGAATKKYLILIFGIVIIFMSHYEYVVLQKALEQNKIEMMNNYFPLLYTIFGLIVIYFQFFVIKK